ncbi:hypothetical protein VTN00DRAFT_4081 [Thermoascus crustaceus]|uniref:uncharacterized protein n=1 Tax=Thermoascus crustaceus TaxID=5088 RepID=UPI003743B038
MTNFLSFGHRELWFKSSLYCRGQPQPQQAWQLFSLHPLMSIAKDAVRGRPEVKRTTKQYPRALDRGFWRKYGAHDWRAALLPDLPPHKLAVPTEMAHVLGRRAIRHHTSSRRPWVLLAASRPSTDSNPASGAHGPCPWSQFPWTLFWYRLARSRDPVAGAYASHTVPPTRPVGWERDKPSAADKHSRDAASVTQLGNDRRLSDDHAAYGETGAPSGHFGVLRTPESSNCEYTVRVAERGRKKWSVKSPGNSLSGYLTEYGEVEHGLVRFAAGMETAPGSSRVLPDVTACARREPDSTALRFPGCGLGSDWPRAG